MKTRIVAVEVEDTVLPLWKAAFFPLMPDAELVLLQAVSPGTEVDAAVVWTPPAGLLASLHGLRFVLSRGAGVDRLIDPSYVPEAATLLRMQEPAIADKMSEFIALSVLFLHRGWMDLRARALEKRWTVEAPSLPARSRTIGILGLGQLGRAAAERLHPFGFPLLGWSREARSVPGIDTFSGRSGLDELAARSDILVALLPATAETENLIDARLLAQLPRGAMLINAGRGASLVEADLLSALDRGQVAGAILDVTREEPLSSGHPFWAHPRIVLTLHGAAVLTPEEEAHASARILRNAFDGADPPERVDRSRGY